MDPVPKPELMSAAAQSAAYAAADFGGSESYLAASLADRLGSGLSDTVAGLGCGPGNMALRIAESLAFRS